eukprot:COSAG04_NODE_370_length_15729_cov_5.743506_2_plen_1041_part_00
MPPRGRGRGEGAVGGANRGGRPPDWAPDGLKIPRGTGRDPEFIDGEKRFRDEREKCLAVAEQFEKLFPQTSGAEDLKLKQTVLDLCEKVNDTAALRFAAIEGGAEADDEIASAQNLKQQAETRLAELSGTDDPDYKFLLGDRGYAFVNGVRFPGDLANHPEPENWNVAAGLLRDMDCLDRSSNLPAQAREQQEAGTLVPQLKNKLEYKDQVLSLIGDIYTRDAAATALAALDVKKTNHANDLKQAQRGIADILLDLSAFEELGEVAKKHRLEGDHDAALREIKAVYDSLRTDVAVPDVFKTEQPAAAAAEEPAAAAAPGTKRKESALARTNTFLEQDYSWGVLSQLLVKMADSGEEMSTQEFGDNTDPEGSEEISFAKFDGFLTDIFVVLEKPKPDGDIIAATWRYLTKQDDTSGLVTKEFYMKAIHEARDEVKRKAEGSDSSVSDRLSANRAAKQAKTDMGLSDRVKGGGEEVLLLCDRIKGDAAPEDFEAVAPESVEPEAELDLAGRTRGGGTQIVYKADALQQLRALPDSCAHVLYTNPPFAITGAKWDQALPWELLWPEIWRVLQPKGVVILHASMPFTSDLINSQRKYYRYSYVWQKNNSTGFLSAKYQPMREHEDVVVFYKHTGGTYNPQMVGDEFHKKRVVRHGGAEEYWGNSPDKNEEKVEGGHTGRYPTTVLNYPIKKGAGGAATRCEEMVEYFVKTYSNAGDTVLDITCYDAITGGVCRDMGRSYIGIDVEPRVTNGITVVGAEQLPVGGDEGGGDSEPAGEFGVGQVVAVRRHKNKNKQGPIAKVLKDAYILDTSEGKLTVSKTNVVALKKTGDERIQELERQIAQMQMELDAEPQPEPEPEPPSPLRPPQWSKLSVSELKILLTAFPQPVDGSKSDLVERLARRTGTAGDGDGASTKSSKSSTSDDSQLPSGWRKTVLSEQAGGGHYYYHEDDPGSINWEKPEHNGLLRTRPVAPAKEPDADTPLVLSSLKDPEPKPFSLSGAGANGKSSEGHFVLKDTRAPEPEPAEKAEPETLRRNDSSGSSLDWW